MGNSQTNYTDQLEREIQLIPDEYLPNLLSLVRLFRESITLKPAEASFRQGWKEAMNGETLPIEELWVDVDEE